MLRIYACIVQEHDLRLVLLAGLICFFATYTAFSLVARAQSSGPRARSNWLVAAAFATGCGVWATHFIAMLAFNPHIPMGYDLEQTAASILIAVMVSGLGLAVAVHGGRPGRIFGGIIVGAGIGAMHYTGMAALQVPGTITYDTGMVIASMIIGMVLGGVAVNLMYVGAQGASQRAGAALVLALGICGMHFTGMGATHIFPDANVQIPASTVAPALLAVAITAVAVLILALGLAGAIVDEHLAAREQQERALLRASEKRFKDLAEASFEGVLTHVDGRIADANAALCAMLGYRLHEVVDHHILEFVDPECRELVRVRLAEGVSTPSEVNLMHADGTVIPMEVFARAMDYHDGAARVVALRDLRERKRAEARIHHLAHHDTLTGLPNRRLFLDRLAQTIAQAERTGGSVAVLCLDLDRFKNVNDLLGHWAGDELLRIVAERLLQNVRANDTVARLSGDEFAIIQTDVAMPDGPALLADRLVKCVAQPVDFDGQQMVVGTSVGVALFPSDAGSGDDLIRAADTALYRAKEAGRHTFRFFEAAMDIRLQERARLERDLRGALATGQLAVHYQPLFRCEAGEPVGFEALVRWDHPERGFISPADFIPLAEDCGLILPLGNWVLRTACRDALSWPDHTKVAVNLSPAQFRHGDLASEVLSILRETGLPPHRLELEITEGVLITDTDRTLTILRALKDVGIHISLDDFGTGYSSLSYLQRFPFDKLKIDRSFVWQMEDSPESMSIVRAVIALGHSLKITVTAEGVETEQQLALLQGEHCDQVQGFLLGRPKPLECALETMQIAKFVSRAKAKMG